MADSIKYAMELSQAVCGIVDRPPEVPIETVEVVIGLDRLPREKALTIPIWEAMVLNRVRGNNTTFRANVKLPALSEEKDREIRRASRTVLGIA